MTQTLPAPMTPADCDLQSFSFMPLHVARLRDSDLAATAHPEACWYAVLLWAASWHQIPAASLPNDDAVLTRLIGLGRDVKTFRKHKAHALHGFVLCEDGRLYHPVVAEQALEAWDSKWEQRWRTECGRIKKANQRNGTSTPYPSLEEFRASAARSGAEDVPGTHGSNVPDETEECPPGQSVQQTQTGTQTGKEGSSEPSLSGEAPASAPSRRKRAEPIPADFPDGEAIEAARRFVDQAGAELSVEAHAKRFRAHALSQDRRVADWAAAWMGWIGQELERAPRAPVEAGPGPLTPAPWSGPADVLDAVRANLDDPKYAETYLRACSWRDVPERALVTASATIFDKLAACGPALQRLGIRIVLERGQAA